MSDPNWLSYLPHEACAYAWAVGVFLGSGLVYGAWKTLKKMKKRAIQPIRKNLGRSRKVSRTKLTIVWSKDSYNEHDRKPTRHAVE